MISTEPVSVPVASPAEVGRLFELQQSHYLEVGKSTARERIARLRRLREAVLRHRQAIKDAMWADFRKPAFEVDAVEVFPLSVAVRHASRNLHRWMHPKRVPTSAMFAGSSSWIQYEPRGVCLLISPWNFPFNISFVPLVSAIAAGNCVILKPSEKTPHSSALIKKIISETFDEREVAVVEGDAGTAAALLELPFHHIFFTGSPTIGKIVMQAAARHLTSVTLELGGKSPTVIDETADLRAAASRTVRGKFANCGQICLAPDYILVQEKVKDEFLRLLLEAIRASYGEDALQSGSYCRLVNHQHFSRLKHCLDDAVSRGANILCGGQSEGESNFLAPTVLEGVPPDALLMREEIFGPLLPVFSFKDLGEAIGIIQEQERPLTMSIFSRSRKNIERLLVETRAGNSCINHAQLHFYNQELPFGGVNNSGMGKVHGWHGFENFSNARSIYRQHTWGPTDALRAPYTKFTEWMMDLTIKWL
jgi:aldehyde dehydrogenase (NAD+)